MDRRVKRVIILMEQGFDQPLSVADLAKAVNLSPGRLCHIFKSETNVALLQYLRALRMEQAKKLLQTTFLSVKEVMMEVGVRDESHFVRDFESAYGVSPARFRLSLELENGPAKELTAELANR
jgi:AraC family transcriptional regulator, arabinose operon regulatory protein